MERLADQILRRIGALARAAQTLADHKYRVFALQKSQFIYLARIAERPGIGLAELSALLRVDKTSSTKSVQKLESLGYVRRAPDETDGRAFRLTLTPAAVRLYDTIIREENRRIVLCFKGFGEEERRMASMLIGRMNRNPDESWNRIKKRGMDMIRKAEPRDLGAVMAIIRGRFRLCRPLPFGHAEKWKITPIAAERAI